MPVAQVLRSLVFSNFRLVFPRWFFKTLIETLGRTLEDYCDWFWGGWGISEGILAALPSK